MQLTGGQVALFDLARPRHAPRSEQGSGIDLALPAYPPFAGGVADIRGFGGWDQLQAGLWLVKDTV